MITQVHRRAQGAAEKRVIHPYREWGIGLCVMTVCFLGGVAYSAYTYIQFNTIEDQLDTPAPKVIRYQESTVDRTLEFFSARRTAYQAVLTQEVATPVSTTTPAVFETDIDTPTETEIEAGELTIE